MDGGLVPAKKMVDEQSGRKAGGGGSMSIFEPGGSKDVIDLTVTGRRRC